MHAGLLLIVAPHRTYLYLPSRYSEWYYPSIGASIVSGPTLPTTRSIVIAFTEREGSRHAPIGHDLVYVVGSRARTWCLEKHYYIAVSFAEEWYRYKRVYRWYVAFMAEFRQL